MTLSIKLVESVLVKAVIDQKITHKQATHLFNQIQRKMEQKHDFKTEIGKP